MKSNPAIPANSLLFEPMEDVYGSRLALVFGNEFNAGKCPFYEKQCIHCYIGAGEGAQFNYELNRQRLEFFKSHYKNILKYVTHLIVYNSGSVLNQKEMSRETLKEILDYASSLEACKVVSFDSREMFVTDENLKHILANLREDQQVRIILGVETHNDAVRIDKLRKYMTKQAIERVFETVTKYNDKVSIDINVVFQPPELKGKEAVEEAIKTIEYGLDLSQKYGISVDFNFHPYYPTKKSREKYPKHQRADLKKVIEALVRTKKLIEKKRSNAKVFVGWQDEEHDQGQETRRKELKTHQSRFNEFNKTQYVKNL